MSRMCLGIRPDTCSDSGSHIAVHMVVGHTVATVDGKLLPYRMWSSDFEAGVSAAS